MTTATKEILALDKKEGKPLDLLREVLDTLGATYETLVPEEPDRIVRKYHRGPEDLTGIYLDPFLEPNSIVFAQQVGELTLITAIEQLTKVKCISFRTQLNLGQKILTKLDLINHPGSLEEKYKGRLPSGRILVKARGKDLYLFFEAKPGQYIGQCEANVTIPNCLTTESPMNQTLDIHLSYNGDDPYWMELTGRISVWNF